MAYDPAKAALFNKLRQQGLSENAAADQAGIPADSADYVFTGKYNADGTLNPNPGTLGADIQGAARVAGVDYDKITAADAAESNRFNQGLQSPSNFEQVDYQVAAKNPPSKVTPINYTTTSTNTVSGGGSTTITAGPKVSTAGSEALQPAINAKQAEIDAFNKDNPSPFARKKQGLPPLTPEENEARIAKQSELNDQRTALVNGQTELKADTPPTITTVPNTTTTTQTVTTGTAATNQAVDPFNDQQLSQQNETQLAASPSVANALTAREAAPVVQSETTVDEFGQVVAAEPVDDPFEASRLAAEAALDEQPQEFSPADVGEEDPFEAARLEQEQELNREDLALNATDVEPDQDPFEASRLEAEAALDDQPQEFSPEDVGEEDPFEAARLEREQELNREDLEINATEAEPVDAEALGDSYGFNSEETEGADPTLLAGEEDVEDAQSRRVNAAQKSAINQATLQARYKQPANDDWRVRLSLSIGANYLYKDPSPGILAPLAKTDGVVFPYTPTIDTSYVANYEKSDLVHSNYRGAFYKNSAVQDVSIRGMFTAQDTNEAAYMLAVIHFFRSVTKMFYGKDAQRGAPPPLVYLSGFGDFQFAGHPCVVTNFGYTLPSDVDYIRANNPNNYGTDLLNRRAAAVSAPVPFSSQLSRLINSGLGAVSGAQPNTPTQSPVTQTVTNTARATYVPTKIEISITLLPMQTRDQISKQFSLKDFANGKLIQGGFW
jgi:hypothetical protein